MVAFRPEGTNVDSLTMVFFINRDVNRSYNMIIGKVFLVISYNGLLIQSQHSLKKWLILQIYIQI